MLKLQFWQFENFFRIKHTSQVLGEREHNVYVCKGLLLLVLIDALVKHSHNICMYVYVYVCTVKNS